MSKVTSCVADPMPLALDSGLAIQDDRTRLGIQWNSTWPESYRPTVHLFTL
ncbi:MAG: hypothetical protein NWF13_09905 [Candidatus Bathyarchaeota archaeon]|nr:hypothetical protein [Candidatus Bathyarchaeota archaeon]